MEEKLKKTSNEVPYLFFHLVFFIVLIGCGILKRNFIEPTYISIVPPSREFLLTTGELPIQDYDPIALIHTERRGLYLLWWVPIISSSLKRTVNERLIREAKNLGADGLIRISYSFNTSPSSFAEQLAILGTTLWIVSADGLAVKRRQ